MFFATRFLAGLALTALLGAAAAAYGAGLTRTLLLTYNPALFAAGAACLVAAVLVMRIRRSAPAAD